MITGGDSGIGRAVAVLYTREGADVAIVHLPQEQSDAEVTRRVVTSHGRRCLLIPADLTSTRACKRAVEETVKKLGTIDILVSNSAHQARKKTLEEVADEELDLTFRTHVYAYFRLARAAVRHMAAGSAIIATSSETGIFGSKNLPDYSATKGAINALTQTLALLLIEKGIRVNAVAREIGILPIWICPIHARRPAIAPCG